MSRRATAAPLLALWAMALPALGAKLPPPPPAYVEGTAAYESANYDLTVTKMRQAIAKDAVEGLAKFENPNGLDKIDYLPHFYLGFSLDKLGRGDEAHAALKESQRQGAIRGRSSTNMILERILRRLDAVKEAQLRPTAAPPTATPPPRAAPPTATPAPPPPTAVAVARPTTPPEPVRPAERPTEVVVAARPTEKPSPAAKSVPADEDELVSSGVMAGVREGIRSYFKGDYASATRQLTQHVELVPLARLFLAYSLAGAELLKPARDPVAVERARREYAAAKKEGAPTKNEDLISPSIRALLTGKT